MSDLTMRLRTTVHSMWLGSEKVHDPLYIEAADEIERLTTERNEMLEVLQDFMLAAACKNAKTQQFMARFSQAERKASAAISRTTGRGNASIAPSEQT